MSDVLTADEVGALLKAFAELGERDRAQVQAGSPRVRNYDFNCPSKMSREGMKHLKQIHAAFGTTLSGALADYLKVPSYSRFSGFNLMPYREFWENQAETSMLCELSCGPVADRVIVRFSPSIADSCLDILMGGTGVGGSASAEFTGVDCVVFSRVIDVLARDYRKSWSKFVDIEPQISSCQSARLFTHTLSQNEAVAVFDYEVRVSSTVGTVSICILADATTRMPEQPGAAVCTISAEDIAGMGVLGESVREASVDCKVVLGRASLSVQDVSGLRTGDVISLDTPAGSDVELWVSGKPAYSATVGRKGSKVGIKINQSL